MHQERVSKFIKLDWKASSLPSGFGRVTLAVEEYIKRDIGSARGGMRHRNPLKRDNEREKPVNVSMLLAECEINSDRSGAVHLQCMR